MKQRRKTTMIATICLIVSLAGSSFVLHRVDQLRPQATLDEVLFLSSPKLIKRASLGYDGLTACIYWTRAVQYFGYRHHYYAASYNLLAPLLEITTHLDPHLLVAYEFGGSFLAPPPPHGAGQPERAIELMEYGIQNNPDKWRWSATYQTTQDEQIKQNAIEHLRALRVDQDVQHLQEAVTRFGERTGRLPASMAELVASEGLAGTPVDPDGHPYKLSSEGRVEVRVPDDFPFVTKGLPQGYKPGAKFRGLP